MSPRGLIPKASVVIAPGKSIVVKLPPLSRKPWVTPALTYNPTMSPRGLIPQVWVDIAPGKSIVVREGPPARTFDVAPSAKLSASKESLYGRLICASIPGRAQNAPGNHHPRGCNLGRSATCVQ